MWRVNLFQSHHQLFYWSVPEDEDPDYVALLQTPGTLVSYTDEPQGESVCWDAVGHSYYTLSEGEDQTLYHYARI